MNQLFKWVDKFFASLNAYVSLGDAFVIFVGLFLLVAVITFFATSRSYEAKLVKAIDMLNGYFINNPKITEDNLVLFNQIMRHNKVPKLLRKHWQQFMLYRENNASYYMSFENCVVIPLRNSKFKRDKIIMNMFAYVLAGFALIMNTYLAEVTSDIALALQKILLAPVIILIANYIISIVLDLKESAIINDLNQNYQYFETNIDKATKTLPEYVDYEILFDKMEIKKGIPILYQYLQKRAEDEQRELEIARLKNVEHEKFNFDEAGLAGSLVLERAMQEAENYIAERKKYGQDIEQINSEITQEDMNYREITKEYNRQMQVSKESFANFKQQLENASSTIEANYLKKQQQQELDRQRNLERDFDTATDRHKKVIESYQEELDSVDKFIAESRKNLQDAMMAEFATYSGKVYDEVKKVVEEREKDKFNKIKQNIKDLEEELYEKNKQLENSNSSTKENFAKISEKEKSEEYNSNEEIKQVEINKLGIETLDKSEENNKDFENNDSNVKEELGNWNFNFAEETKDEGVIEAQNNISDASSNEYLSYSDYLNQQNEEPFKVEENEESEKETSKESDQKSGDFDWFDSLYEESSTVQQDESEEGENLSNSNETKDDDDSDDDSDWLVSVLTEDSDEDSEPNEIVEEEKEDKVEDKPKKKAGRPRKNVEEDNKPKRKPGRPKKVVEDTTPVIAKRRGRPKKVDSVVETSKRKVGRPKKELTTVATEVKRPVGRPKKKKVGRPRKLVNLETEVVKKKAGRPKKEVTTAPVVKAGRGRPRKIQTLQAQAKKSVGRPKKNVEKYDTKVIKHRGRPKKVNLNAVNSDDDLEAYLKVIDNAIAKENAKIKKTQKALENNANIKTKKKK